MPEKPLSICPLPTVETIKELRRFTRENAHTIARIVAAEWLSDAWLDQHPGNLGNPFAPIIAGLRAVGQQHDRAGSLSPSMSVVRLRLYKLAEEIAEAEGLAPAVASIRAAL